jgi:hypothetical protein
MACEAGAALAAKLGLAHDDEAVADWMIVRSRGAPEGVIFNRIETRPPHAVVDQ